MDSGRVPRTIECEVSRELVERVIPGDVVEITGIVKVAPSEKGIEVLVEYNVDTCLIFTIAHKLQLFSSVFTSQNRQHHVPALHRRQLYYKGNNH